MSSEITITGSLSCYKPSIMTSTIGRSVTGLAFNMAGLFLVQGSISVAISATAIPLGQVTAPHWAWFRNMDATNFVTIRNGSGGADLIKLLPGECTPGGVPLLDTSVPYAVANTAPVQLEYLIFSL